MKIVKVSLPVGLLVYRQAGRTKCEEEARCRLCERPSSVRVLTRHHIVGQVWFKRRSFLMLTGHGYVPYGSTMLRDCDANVVPLCVPCHAFVDKHGEWEGRRMLRKVLAPEEAAFAVKMITQAGFDHYYPPYGPTADRVRPLGGVWARTDYQESVRERAAENFRAAWEATGGSRVA